MGTIETGKAFKNKRQRVLEINNRLTKIRIGLLVGIVVVLAMPAMLNLDFFGSSKENVVILGTWADDSNAGLLQIVEKKNDIYLIKNQKFDYKLKKTIRNGNVIYINTNNMEEYYQILPDGNLAVFDKFGYIRTYNKWTGEKPKNVATKTEKAETKKENIVTLGTWADDYTAGLLWQIVEKKNGIYILMANQELHCELKKNN